MKKLFLFCMLVVFAGCAHRQVQRSHGDLTGKQLMEMRTSLEEKDAKISQLETLVSQQQAQLQEKDAQIQSLKERLAQFGVF